MFILLQINAINKKKGENDLADPSPLSDCLRLYGSDSTVSLSRFSVSPTKRLDPFLAEDSLALTSPEHKDLLSPARA